MSTDHGTIVYRLKLADGEKHEFSVPLDREEGALGSVMPEWTKLDYKRCPNCPLSSEEHARCPASVDAAHVFEKFHARVSYDRVEISVEGAGRHVKTESDMQTALQSILGLIMATSACPILGRFRGMARFHLPLSSMAETIERSVGFHLLQEAFAFEAGEQPDLELTRLREFYDEIQEVNRALIKRIEGAAKADANINAIAQLFCVSALVVASIDDELDSLSESYGLAAASGEGEKDGD